MSTKKKNRFGASESELSTLSSSIAKGTEKAYAEKADVIAGGYSKNKAIGSLGSAVIKNASNDPSTARKNRFISSEALLYNNPAFAYAVTEKSKPVNKASDATVKGSDAIPQEDVEWYKKILRGIDTGLTRAGKSIISVADVITSLGDEEGGPLQELWYMFGGDRIFEDAGDNAIGIKGLDFKDNPIKAFNKLGDKEVEYRQNRDASYQDDPLYKYSSMASESASMMLPTIMSGGATAAADTAALVNASRVGQATSKLAQTGLISKNAIKQFASRPDAKYIFASSAGSSYDEAKQDGADDLQALAYAALNSAATTVTELGGLSEFGGLQKLPEWVQNAIKKGNKSLLLNYVKSVGEEVSEEIIQGVLGRGLKSIYTDVPLYDPNNENSVINPKAALEEATGAAIVTTLLGIPTTGVNAAYRAKQRGEAGRQLYGDAQRELVDEGLESEWGTKSHELAWKYNAKLNSGKQLTGNELYKLAQANDKAIAQESNANSAVAPSTETEQIYEDDRNTIPYAVLNNPYAVAPQVVENMPASEIATDSTINDMASKYKVSNSLIGKIYNLSPTATPQVFEASFDAAYKMGAESVDVSLLSQIPALTKQQARIAYNIGNEKGMEAENNEVRVRESGERAGSEDTGRQVSAVEERPRADKGRETESKSAVRKRTTRENGQLIYNGKVQDGITIATDETKPMRQGRKLAESMGYKVTYFKGGNLSIENGSVRGAVDTAAKTVYVRADHPELDAYQIMRHEMGHERIASGELILDDVRDMLHETFTDAELDEISQRYADAYTMEDGSKVLTAEEAFEEICCDALGKINIFAGTEHNSANYERAQEAIRKHAAQTSNSQGRAPPRSGVKYSKQIEDKYFARQIERWDGKDHGGAFRVGEVSKPLLSVGIPNTDIWFDQSKAAKQLLEKGEITKAVIKQIPEILQHPIAISESYDNTVMIFGQVFDANSNPIVVALRVNSTKRRNSITLVNKIRSVGSRSHNLDKLLSESKILYLGENKKETKTWFNALGRSTPFGGTKFGFIRSVSFSGDAVKKYSLEPQEDAKANVKRAEEYFGTTYKIKEAGYITTDGKLLDFSGRHEGASGGYRTVDHREISDALSEEYGGAMVRFVGEGNIRVSPEIGGINLSVLPNKAQRSTLDRYISNFRGEVVLDIDDTNGGTVVSVEYPKYTHSSVVFKDIDDYFNKGKIPEKFTRFSREPEGLAELRRQNKELKARVDYWKGQTQRTKVKTVRESDINRLAHEVIEMSETDLKPKDITERLNKLGEYILNEEELRYTDVAEMAQDIAEDVVENATAIVNEEDIEVHNSLKDYLKRVKLKDDGSAEFKSIRQNYKRRIMFDKHGMDVDVAYMELHDMFGEGFFPEGIINPADQLDRIAEVLDSTAPKYDNPNSYYSKEAAEYMRNYIIDSMLSDQVRQTAPTAADRAAAREAKLKANNAERVRNAIAKERERNGRKLERFKDSVARLDSKRKETALRNSYKAQIEKNIKTLSDWLLKPDHKNELKHIPGQLQSTVRDFIASIDFTSARQLGGGAPTVKDMRYLDSLDRLRRYITDSNVGEDRYSGYLDLPPEFETQLTNFVNDVNTLARNNKGVYTINNMTSEQLKELSDIVKTMKKAITDMNRLYQNMTFQNAYDAGAADVRTLKGYTKTKAFTNKLATNRLDQTVMWEQSRPAHVFKRFGKGGESIYKELADAQGTMAFLIKEVIDFANKTFTSKEVKQWAKETHKFEFYGDTVTLTSAQLMSLYELNKREQAKQHLDSGGFKVANFKNGVFELKQDATNHVLTETELDEMFSKLTDRQKEVADKLQRFMKERGGMWGNYVSVKRFDVEMFKDEYYFPIKIDKGQIDSKDAEKVENSSLYQLLNMGSAKDVSAKANQAIVVYDIFDVFANHMSEMAQYRSFALPVLDMLKWYNYKERNESGIVTASLREEMRRAFGSDINGRGFAEQFITGIIKAYSGAEGRGDSSVNSKMLNRVNRSAVAYNTRVMIQQPSAIVRAAMYLDPKDLATSLKNYTGITTRQNIEEMHKYSGAAVWKDFGFYDANVSPAVQELIKHSQGAISKINEIGMKGAAFADKVTWAALWDASKMKVRRETGLSETDVEFFPKVTEVFENVVYNTQVVDTVLTKSELSRNRDFGNRLFTSFMSEPMTTASLVTSEIFDIQMKQAKGIKLKPSDYSRLSKTCIVVAVAAVVNSALAAFADAWRDDDDYGTFGEKWIRAMRVKLADELNPLTYFPYMSNVWDITKMMLDNADKKWFGVEVYGNSTDIPLADVVESMIKAMDIFNEISDKGESSKYTKLGGYYKVVNILSKVTGIPFYNVAREAVSLHNILWPDSKWRAYEPSPESAVKYAWRDGYLTDDEAIAALQDDAGMDEGKAWLEVEKWKTGANSNYTKLYDALDSGGDIKKAVDELTEHGTEEGTVKRQITNHFKEAYINGDNKERERIRRAMYATGLYDSVNDVIEKCNDWLKEG